jgi:hypothetical protein
MNLQIISGMSVKKHPMSSVITFSLRVLLTVLLLFGLSEAQTCLTSGDMDQPTRTALDAAARRYFDMAAKGDSAGLKQSSIASLAGDFSGVETAVKDNQSTLAGQAGSPRPPYLLKIEGSAPVQRAEFLCGVFGANGQTANSAEFVIPNLQPGNYAVVTLDVSGAKPRTVSFVLQQQGADWKVGGFYVKDPQIGGHDSKWFADKARAFKTKGQTHTAWLYFLEARELAVPLPFMYTQTTDKLYDESESVKPADLPSGGSAVDLAGAGKTYRLTAAFPLPVGQDFDLVIKYETASIADTGKTFQENSAVMKAVLTKFPEFRDAFDGMVVRAVEPSGRDYGSMLAMKDIK